MVSSKNVSLILLHSQTKNRNVFNSFSIAHKPLKTKHTRLTDWNVKQFKKDFLAVVNILQIDQFERDGRKS